MVVSSKTLFNTYCKKLKIFTWHVHGSYLYYLSQINHDIYIPYDEMKSEGYSGKSGFFPWKDNVHEIDIKKVRGMNFDCIIFQSKKNYFEDQFKILSKKQRNLPMIYIEHDPPRQSPTDTRHFVDSKDAIIVHVTNFNKLMWDNNQTPAFVIEHGIYQSSTKYTGEINKGIVVINNLYSRGRRLGSDIYEYINRYVPLDIIGIDSEKYKGLGEIAHDKLPQFISKYRFFFNPIRYTSLPLSMCEAMMAGMPVVALATTEIVSVIENGWNGFVSNDFNYLISKMKRLITDKKLAVDLGNNAKNYAENRFSILRFVKSWDVLLRLAVEIRSNHFMQRNQEYKENNSEFTNLNNETQLLPI
jgi:glycosyltransferase involved in cell wall biosynthesis